MRYEGRKDRHTPKKTHYSVYSTETHQMRYEGRKERHQDSDAIQSSTPVDFNDSTNATDRVSQ